MKRLSSREEKKGEDQITEQGVSTTKKKSAMITFFLPMQEREEGVRHPRERHPMFSFFFFLMVYARGERWRSRARDR